MGVVHINVEYSGACRLADEAMTTRRVLSDWLRTYDEIEDISAVPSAEASIRVSIDGESVWRADPDEDIDPMDALAAVRQQLSSV